MEKKENNNSLKSENKPKRNYQKRARIPKKNLEKKQEIVKEKTLQEITDDLKRVRKTRNSKQITKKENSKDNLDFRFKKEKLKIIPLGGLQEIGKNITVFEYGDDIVVVDCGLAFP